MQPTSETAVHIDFEGGVLHCNYLLPGCCELAKDFTCYYNKIQHQTKNMFYETIYPASRSRSVFSHRFFR